MADLAFEAWSSEPRRLHPAAFLFRLGRIGRQFALPALLALFAGGDRGQLLIAGPAVIGLVGTVASWWRYTYAFDGRVFTIDEGIFNRRHRTVPVDRIQQVDVESKLSHRLFGVGSLRIDTGAGSAGAEVNLAAVSRDEAERLRSALLSRAGKSTEVAAPAPAEAPAGVPAGVVVGDRTEKPIVRLGPGLLALGGITGPEQLVMVGILFSLLHFVDELPDSWFEHTDVPVVPIGPIVAVLVIVVVVAVWFALAAASAILKYYDFTLECRDDAVQIRRGLLDRREASLALRRLQAVAIQQTVMRRAFGLLSLRFTSGGGAASRGSDSVSQLLVPVLPAADVEDVLRKVNPESVPLPPLVPAPKAALRRAFVRWTVPASAGALAFSVLLWPLGALALVAVPLAALFAYAKYRGLGYGVSDAVVVARSGALHRKTIVVDKAKVQSCSVESSPFQRRAGLANLRVALAGAHSATIKEADARALHGLYDGIAAARRVRRDETRVRHDVSERR